MPYVTHKPEGSPWPKGYSRGPVLDRKDRELEPALDRFMPGETREVGPRQAHYLLSTFPAHFVEGTAPVPLETASTETGLTDPPPADLADGEPPKG